jgi:subtilase family serine protease
MAVLVAALLLFAFAVPALAQTKSGEGRVTIPESSKANPGDAGVRFHSNVEIFTPKAGKPAEAPPYSGYAFETPASLACLYGLVSPGAGISPNCNPNLTTVNPTGGSNTIAIVDAYDDPNAGNDLTTFSTQFGLPEATFKVYYATGTRPSQDPTGGWELEESLDIEWAHAMAPNASIYLVEAASDSNAHLLQAVSVASNLVRCGKVTTCSAKATGTGEVIMSWGGEEYRSEIFADVYFTTPGVVYFAASGDAPGVNYPCTSPRVVCAGGTTTARNPYNDDFLYEVTWTEGGGGVSAYERIPSYQSSISSISSLVGTFRGVPDVSFDSNPDTGLWTYDSIEYEGETGWWILGGTSVADVGWAGIVNAAGSFAPSSVSELTTIYSNLGVSTDFHDITYGWCGPYAGYLAVAGWDMCTGVGSPVGYTGK